MSHYHWMLFWLALAVGCLAVPSVLALLPAVLLTKPQVTRVMFVCSLVIALLAGVLVLADW